MAYAEVDRSGQSFWIFSFYFKVGISGDFWEFRMGGVVNNWL